MLTRLICCLVMGATLLALGVRPTRSRIEFSAFVGWTLSAWLFGLAVFGEAR